MNASASIVCSVANGLPRIEEMVSQPPLTFRETTDGVMIVNTAAGPLGGDRLHLRATVKDGAELKLGGVAASMALPGAPGTGFSQSNILITLGDAAKLIWLPQPIIMADGSHHRQMITINAQPSSQFIYGDAFQFGRHKEETGRIEQHVAVNIDGIPVLRQSTDINPEDDWKEAFSLQEAHTFGSHITFGIEISNSAEFTKFELENGIHIYQSIGTLLAPKLSVKVAM